MLYRSRGEPYKEEHREAVLPKIRSIPVTEEKQNIQVLHKAFRRLDAFLADMFDIPWHGG